MVDARRDEEKFSRDDRKIIDVVLAMDVTLPITEALLRIHQRRERRTA